MSLKFNAFTGNLDIVLGTNPLEATDVVLDAGGAIYWGDQDTNGSWRMIRVDNNLEVQRRESGVWNQKALFLP